MADPVLTTEEKKQALISIRRFCVENLDMEIPVGDLTADLLLDFFLKEIGPSVYNHAVSDAQAYLRDRVTDLEGVCYKPEFTFWPKASSRKPA
jgi:uncharacterized protein (DUF2164 family)